MYYMKIIINIVFLILFIIPLLAREYKDDEIPILRDDLLDIAQSSIDNGNFDNAITIYQQILNHQIENHGLINNDVARTSQRIGDLMILASRFDDANKLTT